MAAVRHSEREARNATQARALDAGVDLARLPRHVAVIMDGNGRWASGRGLQRLIGHRQGYRTLRDILLASSELGIEVLTVYAFSVENWRRPESEVGGLMRLIEEAAKSELRGLRQNNVRVRVAGRLDELPAPARRALDDLVETTQECDGITFVLAINYGGRAEIVDAVRALIREGVPEAEVTEEAVARRLYCPDLPEPDLMVRTAGEMRWSNFLLWQAAYAELFVTQVPWPEFNEAELVRAILEYQRRDRKFGMTSEQRKADG
ncbi:MAG: di-trans,poly-cis-decaprenylcistransferase [Fimbriimonadaceae bacterium]|nr:di-trans,poly-cis-decaprenylcistransferase [Fimbriimonadaceae bacterium]QYK54781.1 MAG: di-trans,poly-cis-decaprenylcistransferase [Fimbriimonadaceae bacterium]